MREALTAAALLDACDHVRSLERDRIAPLDDLAHGEALQAGIVIARLARGERAVGYKIGFTNRAIWPLYGVFHPIWGPVWDTTVVHATDAAANSAARVTAARFVEPRIEPEIVIGLRAAPARDTPEAVLAATEWIAHGFEIVQSPYPGWRFSAAEAVAAQALHGALILGPKRPVSILDGEPDPPPAQPPDPARAARALARLGACELDLICDGRLVEQGRGANALDGPMHAVAHLTHALRLRGRSLEAGSLVTTGTLTDAAPLIAGQRWETRLRGLDLPGLVLEVD
jgi:2-oxo-3-hexenedioate decarboxylase